MKKLSFRKKHFPTPGRHSCESTLLSGENLLGIEKGNMRAKFRSKRDEEKLKKDCKPFGFELFALDCFAPLAMTIWGSRGATTAFFFSPSPDASLRAERSNPVQMLIPKEYNWVFNLPRTVECVNRNDGGKSTQLISPQIIYDRQ